MYCQSCGTATTPGLSYCKNCGAELSANERSSRRPSELPAFLVGAMVALFIFGLGVITGLIAVMRASGLNEGLINGFAVLTFLLMVIIEAIFTGLLLRSTLGRKKTGEPPARAATNELPQALAAPPLSVTEHTTRTLEPEKRRQ
ncbi:MAG TPA: hypothetical protein VKA60_26725 [Blastocatellia bacterium]|nr:hypothetical protein [Blastocatellia bacterium]